MSNSPLTYPTFSHQLANLYGFSPIARSEMWAEVKGPGDGKDNFAWWDICRRMCMKLPGGEERFEYMVDMWWDGSRHSVVNKWRGKSRQFVVDEKKHDNDETWELVGSHQKRVSWGENQVYVITPIWTLMREWDILGTIGQP